MITHIQFNKLDPNISFDLNDKTYITNEELMNIMNVKYYSLDQDEYATKLKSNKQMQTVELIHNKGEQLLTISRILKLIQPKINPIFVYTDGSCTGMHGKTPIAICGFAIDDMIRGEYNIKENHNLFNNYTFRRQLKEQKYALVEDKIKPIEEFSRPTNNRAELLGICFALLHIKKSSYAHVTLISDSGYSIGSLTKWKMNDKKLNPDIINIGLQLLSDLQQMNKVIIFEHIRSHQPKPIWNKSLTDLENCTILRKWEGNARVDKLITD